ncbi:MAG: diacylglycerol kinase family lipid kinase [Actinobacteria bacterium]|nr:diacylglycerol kinase family lipid kinase [Actinomycetota bacterium]
MLLHLIVNPTASSVTPRARIVIGKALGADAEVKVNTTNRRGHATDLAGQAVSAGADSVVVLGGDGTLNEVACALAGTEVRLGVLPGGSTNVFARSLGMSDDPVEATSQLLDALDDMPAHEHHVSLGIVNGRHFVFHTGIGFDAAVVKQVEKKGHLKRWAGHPLFVWAAFRTWATYDRRARFHVTLANQTPQPSPFTVILNKNPYTYLGERPINIAPTADFDTGFSVACFRSLALLPTMATAGRALLGQAGLQTGKSIEVSHGVGHVTIESEEPFHYQVDGDYIGTETRLRIEHRPASLWVLQPGHAVGMAPADRL